MPDASYHLAYLQYNGNKSRANKCLALCFSAFVFWLSALNFRHFRSFQGILGISFLGPPLVGRAAFQGPELDGVIRINQGGAEPGSFVKVRITEAHHYDLTGDMV